MWIFVMLKLLINIVNLNESEGKSVFIIRNLDNSFLSLIVEA